MNNTPERRLKLLLVMVPGEEDDAYRDEQAGRLRDPIEDQVDGAEADRETGGVLPEGARAGELVPIAGAIALALLPGAVTALFELLRHWGYRRYRIRVGDIEVELPGGSTWEEAEDRIKHLLEQHGRHGSE